MRTPNAHCALCRKPVYRRPNELEKIRYVACISCRAEAQRLFGVTESQHQGLRQGRVKGTNHRTGYKHREESKAKASVSHKAFWAAHPELAVARGEKIRGYKHYKWQGGITRVNVSVRQMRENRNWMDAVKIRDNFICVRCKSKDDIEAHHILPLSFLLDALGIRTRDEARQFAAVLWDLKNGETLCRICHYLEHGRKPRANKRKKTRKNAARVAEAVSEIAE